MNNVPDAIVPPLVELDWILISRSIECTALFERARTVGALCPMEDLSNLLAPLFLRYRKYSHVLGFRRNECAPPKISIIKARIRERLKVGLLKKNSNNVITDCTFSQIADPGLHLLLIDNAYCLILTINNRRT